MEEEEAEEETAAALVKLSVWWPCWETYMVLKSGYLSQPGVLERAAPGFQLCLSPRSAEARTRGLCIIPSPVLELQVL